MERWEIKITASPNPSWYVFREVIQQVFSEFTGETVPAESHTGFYDSWEELNPSGMGLRFNVTARVTDPRDTPGMNNQVEFVSVGWPDVEISTFLGFAYEPYALEVKDPLVMTVMTDLTKDAQQSLYKSLESAFQARRHSISMLPPSKS